MPLIAYNIPSRVIVNVSTSELEELARIDTVVGVKQANNDELGPIEGMAVLAGNDDIYLRTLELGLAGGIQVASNVVGRQMRDIWDAVEAGDLDRAREIDDGLRPLYEALSVTTNPMPIKAAMAMTGAIPSGTMRLPMVELDDAQRDVVRTALESVGLTVTAS
jgi:4-hydroxy-tetrahydrodipicolinate synthase